MRCDFTLSLMAAEESVLLNIFLVFLVNLFILFSFFSFPFSNTNCGSKSQLITGGKIEQ